MRILVETHMARRTNASTIVSVTGGPFDVLGPINPTATHRRYIIRAYEPVFIRVRRTTNSGRIYCRDHLITSDCFITAFGEVVRPTEDLMRLEECLRASQRVVATNVKHITLPE